MGSKSATTIHGSRLTLSLPLAKPSISPGQAATAVIWNSLAGPLAFCAEIECTQKLAFIRRINLNRKSLIHFSFRWGASFTLNEMTITNKSALFRVATCYIIIYDHQQVRVVRPTHTQAHTRRELEEPRPGSGEYWNL